MYLKLIAIILSLIVLNNKNLSAVSDSDLSSYEECDYFEYSNGCKDTEGSHCIDGHCICKDHYSVQLTNGYCLKSVSIGEECMTSSQCNKTDINSGCFTTNDHFTEWICKCKQDFYYDKNHTHKCLHQLSYGLECNTSQQCLGDSSVCSSHNKCVCGPDFNYDQFLKVCKHLNNTGCNAGQEWNKFTKKCELKIHYSHKGGGGRGGGRGGSGRSGGRSSGKGSRSYGGSGKSWWTTSWFGSGRRIGVSSYSGSGGYNSEEDESIAFDKVIFILISIVIVMLACCYCSYKFRQQDKDAVEYFRKRSSIKMPHIDFCDEKTTNTNSIQPRIGTSPPPPYSQERGQILPFAMSSSHDSASHSRPQSPSLSMPMSSLTSEPVTHPNDPNKILPFASGPPPAYS